MIIESCFNFNLIWLPFSLYISNIVHSLVQNNGFGFSTDGLKFTYESVGFDLGLLNENDRQEVIEKQPSEGETGYESLIGFNGELTIGPGSLIFWWILILPLLILKTDKLNELFEEEWQFW